MRLHKLAPLYMRKLVRGETFQVHGVTVTVPLAADPVLYKHLARGRPYEEAEAHFVRSALKRSTDVVELGGCLGVVSRVIRDTIGPEADHVVVEANPDLLPVCAANARMAGQTGRTEVLGRAIAYDAQTVTFQHGGNAHVGQVLSVGAASAHAVTVPAMTLSACAAHLPENRPFALVCDIEGSEWDVFEREDGIFSRVAHAIVEVHPHAFAARGASEDDFLDLAAQRGLTPLERRGDVVLFRGPATE